MTAIFPVPAGRTSDLLSQRRLEGQLQSNQIALLRLQDQLATGRRISLPSDDPGAAQRAVSIQRLLEQKAQAKTNLSTSVSYLAATETALTGVSGLLNDIRGVVLGVNDSAHTEAEKAAAIQQIDLAIARLTEVGNQKFRGRYLFAGSTTDVQPFESTAGAVMYLGNESDVRSYSDVDSLFATNVSGHDVFGGLSAGSLGTTDLNPSLTPQTRLVDLHGGAGISRGTFRISDGTTSKIVDLSNAETLADVAGLIEANAPEGRTLTVQIAADHLVISIDAQPGTNLTISDLEGGATAAELGILASGGAGNGPVSGENLDPRLQPTTRLADILGGTFDQASGLQITSGGQTFNINLSAAVTIEDVLNAINSSGANALAEINVSGTGINIRSRLSGVDFSIGENGGTTATQLGVRTFNSETLLSDLNHGFGVNLAQSGADFVIHRKDGTDLSINLAGARTIGDVLNLINTLPGNTTPGTAVVARLRTTGNGIELVDANGAGLDTLTVTKGATSNAAWDLGLVPRDATTATGSVQGGADVLSGRDTNPLETKSVFNSLLRLRTALENGNQGEADRAFNMLDEDLSRVTFARAEIGARTLSLETIGNQLADEDVQLRETLSNEIDADLVQVISELTNKQAAVEASLRVIGQTLQLTLLDFL